MWISSGLALFYIIRFYLSRGAKEPVSEFPADSLGVLIFIVFQGGVGFFVLGHRENSCVS